MKAPASLVGLAACKPNKYIIEIGSRTLEDCAIACYWWKDPPCK